MADCCVTVEGLSSTLSYDFGLLTEIRTSLRQDIKSWPRLNFFQLPTNILEHSLLWLNPVFTCDRKLRISNDAPPVGPVRAATALPSATNNIAVLIVSPEVAKALLQAVYQINFEKSSSRIFEDDEFEAAGSWREALLDHIIVGSKKLPSKQQKIRFFSLLTSKTRYPAKNRHGFRTPTPIPVETFSKRPRLSYDSFRGLNEIQRIRASAF